MKNEKEKERENEKEKEKENENEKQGFYYVEIYNYKLITGHHFGSMCGMRLFDIQDIFCQLCQ